MRLIDEPYTDHPFKGSRRMHTWLTLDKGYPINKKRIECLYSKVMGFRKLAIIDLHNRFVLNWPVYNSMDAQWCKKTLEEAINMHGKPEILNTDQGSQFTSEIFPFCVFSKILNSAWMVKEGP
ncbi:DDE-type integrase/transposase/recombinase [Zunongwangia sp. F260]|uniref:DDE-type integrase/transposase/recombinase n=2 Tax=Autumnicola lenta TaxID=3075593 RepID=A0ABU3CJG6_9FLAO|nr:DDE-type integrase/transposase/recombinase [Zunongwangia sp. F260]MDT0646451.1 DDE-type integrase/transposase/recombinase [Zunongwangia sp. F260]